MPKIPPLKGKTIVAILLKNGFYKHNQTGSHIQMRHTERLHLRVTVPRHDKFELPSFVVGSILKQSEITKEEFLKMLRGE